MGTPGVQAPARLGRYELLARLATGGMGEIFLARLEGAAGFEKLYVIKRILPHLADDGRFRAMLIAEARIASKMAHANICQVYELGETDGQLYIVMEYLEGIALLPLLRKASKEGALLDFGMVGSVVQQCTDALHYAHELRDHANELLGIVHRDVTPGNIFLTDAGMAKLLDFGIAKVKDASANTQTGTVKGKYAYMAPEQLRGGAIDRRADVFGFAVVIYEMIALRRLFQRKTDYLTFRAVMEQPVPDLRRYRPDTPDALAEVLAGALDRDPDRRPATARLLGAAVLDAIATIRRPWSQGDLGDFVRTQFGDEIARQRAETAQAIQRGPGRAVLPLLGPEIPEGEALDDDEDDDGFPTVEASGGDAPLPEMRAGRDLHGMTPPPFGADSRTSAPHEAPGPTPSAVMMSSSPPPMMVVNKRSIVWPMLAIAMVAITATALFLVWKQMQQPPTKQEIIITTEPARPGDEIIAGSGVKPGPTTPPAPVVPPPPPPPPAVGSGSAKRVAPPPPAAASDPYSAVIASYSPQMSACVTSNPITLENAKVLIKVAANGRPTDVTFQPKALNDSPAGVCIAAVLRQAKFPTSREPLTVTVPLFLK